MGIQKHLRPNAAKDRNKSASFRNRHDLRLQISKSHIINKKREEMSFLSNGARNPKPKPLLKLFDRRGMNYGQYHILRTVRNDYQLRREFYKLGIRNKRELEEALLELLFECRNLKYWESGGDNLVDVFHLIKGRVEWASDCSVDLIMQLFFALLQARLGCRSSSRKNACKVALRVDKVISYINGVDHLLAEYDIYKNLVLPIHHTIRKLPRVAKTPASAIPGAVFLQGISRSEK